MGVKGEAGKLSQAKVDGGEHPPPFMLRRSHDGAETFNAAAPKRSGNSEEPQVTRKGPDTSCSSQSVVMVTLEAGRANSLCFQPLQSLKVIMSLLLHQMFERRLANKSATFQRFGCK